MEEYLQYMKTLRTEMNDVEDQAAKISVDEQMHITTIHTLDSDLNSVKSEIKRLADDTQQMEKTKGLLCSKILENQKRISSVEADASTLAQTLQLIHQERSSLYTRLVEKSTFYAKIVEDMTSRLHEQQSWLDGELQKVTQASSMQTDQTKVTSSNSPSFACNLGDGDKGLLLTKLHDEEAKLDEIIIVKNKLASEINEMMQSIEQSKRVLNELKPELVRMDFNTLEEEHKAILSEKAGEMDYLKSLQSQLEKLMGISHAVKCVCGGEYKVAVGLCNEGVLNGIIL